MQIFVDVWNLVIIEPMINSLVLLYSVFFLNFGIAILAFTIIIRALMIPLTVRQSRQLRRMSELQPKLKEIREKHSKDSARQTQETMRLYKEEGVNPIGCLGPMVIQLPIWIGLYQAIIQTLPSTPERLVQLSDHLYPWLPRVHQVIPLDSTFLWLDLAMPDATPVLPVLVGASMWLMQKMTTMPAMDPRQEQTNRMMLWMMPLMLGFFSTQFPSGLALYWVISNIVGIVIQGFITGWGPVTDVLKFGRSEPQSSSAAADAAGGQTAPALVPSAEETATDAHDRNNGQNSRRSNRNRPKGTRRKARGSRNRRR